MKALTDQEIEDLKKLISVTNHHVYEDYPKTKGLDPHIIYFYFVTDPYKEHPDADVYRYDHQHPITNEHVIKEIVKDLANKASIPGHGEMAWSHGFDNEPWRHKSFVVILVDVEGWTFKENWGVVFDPRKGGKPNHSFFDAFNMSVVIDQDPAHPKKRSAICFTNYMAMDEYGNTIGNGEREHFDFWIVSDKASKSRGEPIDPGGTNQGPTLPPPP